MSESSDTFLKTLWNRMQFSCLMSRNANICGNGFHLGLMRLLRSSADSKALLAEWDSWINSLSTEDIRNWTAETRQVLVNDLLEFNRRLVDSIGKNGSWALKSLGKITAALAKQDHELSCFHSIYLDFAICSNNPYCTLELLYNPISKISCDTRVADFLIYHYYGGIILLSLRQRELGLEYLKRVLIVPAQIPSQIQLQAFKKLILTALILDGKFSLKSDKSHVPLYTSSILVKAIKNEGVAYLDFANAFSTLDPSRIQQEYKKNYDLFARQGNLGLVKQVLSSFLDHLLEKQVKVYSRIYFNDLEKESWVSISKDSIDKLSRVELERFLSSKENILIDDRSGEITFTNSKIPIDLKQVLGKLEEIGTKFSEWNKALSLSEDYVSRTVNRTEILEGRVFDERMDMDDLMNL